MEKAQDTSSRNELVLEYQDYVRALSGRLIKSMGLPKGIFEECVAAGYLGLVEAAERFDESRGKPFKPYAFLRIRGSIIDSIRKSSELSSKAYRYAKALQAAHDIREYGGDCEAEGLDPGKLSHALKYAAKGALAYRLSLADIDLDALGIESKDESPEEIFENKQMLNRIQIHLETLSKKERTIIKDYYFKNKSFSEIAKSHEGMSKSWVSRLHTNAIRKLQELMAQEEEDSFSAAA